MLLGRCGQACSDAVLRPPTLPCAGRSGVKLNVKEFVGSVSRLAWARLNGCPWSAMTCAFAARGGHQEVLTWARERGYPWNEGTVVRSPLGAGTWWS
jgi:hypothetical protein